MGHLVRGIKVDDALPLKNLQWVLTQIAPEGKVVPGHGPVTDRMALERYVEMIEASLRIVRGRIAQGWSLAQIQKAGLPSEWESYGHGYRTTEQWLEGVYGELQGTP